jgi:hypothetical protein
MIAQVAQIVYDNICEAAQTPGMAGSFVTAADGRCNSVRRADM